MHPIFAAALAGLGGIFFALLSTYYVIHPRRISDASWYGHFGKYTNLYLFPPGYALLSTVCWAYTADQLGLGGAFTVLSVLAMLCVGLTTIGFVAMLGVPMPPFLTPKWVRDRRKADREAKQRRRADHNVARIEGAKDIGAIHSDTAMDSIRFRKEQDVNERGAAS